MIPSHSVHNLFNCQRGLKWFGGGAKKSPGGLEPPLAPYFPRLWSPLMLDVMQGSYKYQFLSHWFNPTLNRTPSLPFQKQTLYPIGHLGVNNFFCFTILPPSKQVHHRRIGKCVVDTLTFENTIRVLLLE